MAMLKLTPRSSLSGANLIARDAWSQLHGRDPRSKQQRKAQEGGRGRGGGTRGRTEIGDGGAAMLGIGRPLEHVELSDHGGYTLGPNCRRLHNFSVVTKHIFPLRNLESIVRRVHGDTRYYTRLSCDDAWTWSRAVKKKLWSSPRRAVVCSLGARAAAPLQDKFTLDNSF